MNKSLFPEDEESLRLIENQLEHLDSDFFLSNFLFPWQVSLVYHAISGKGYSIEEWGGYDTALRKRVIASKSKIREPMFSISAVNFKPGNEILYANRKTLLDSFYEKGIPFDSIGDIFNVSGSWVLFIDSIYKDTHFTDAEVIPYSKAPETVLRTIQPPQTGTVSSVRLDAVCSVAFKPSRGKLKGLIENGGAMIDYKFIYKGGKDVDEGSVISIRGFSRFRLSEIGETSKKGRIRIKLEFLE